MPPANTIGNASPKTMQVNWFLGYAVSIALLVRSPPPLPTIFLMGGHLPKKRGGKKGQTRPMDGPVPFLFLAVRVITGHVNRSSRSIFPRSPFLGSLWAVATGFLHPCAFRVTRLSILSRGCSALVSWLTRQSLWRPFHALTEGVVA
jgi:hypothetical protein